MRQLNHADVLVCMKNLEAAGSIVIIDHFPIRFGDTHVDVIAAGKELEGRERNEGGGNVSELIDLFENGYLGIALGKGREKICGQVLKQIGNAYGRYHNGHSGRGTQRFIGYLLDYNAEDHRADEGNGNGDVPGKAGHGKNHKISRHHKYIAVGEVYKTKDAVNHRVAYGYKRVGSAQRNTCQTVLDYCG